MVRGFVTVLEPENLTEQTSGIITFGRKVDVDKEIGEMLEERISSLKVSIWKRIADFTLERACS